MTGTSQAPAAMLPVPRLVVNRTAEFEQLHRDIAEALDSGQQGVIVATGLPGVGKTTLMAWCAHQVRDRFPDGVFFAGLGASSETVSPEDVLRRFLRRLGVQKPGATLDDLVDEYQHLTTDKRLLVLLDDVASAAQVKLLLPNSPHSLVLATSRRWAEGFELEDFTVLRVQVFEPASSVELIGNRIEATRLAAAADLRALADLCGHLPLALRIVNARLRSRRHLSAEECLRELRAADSVTGELRVDEDLPVVRIFDAAYAELSYAGRRAHRLLPLHPGARFGVEAARALFGPEQDHPERVLAELVQANLLTEVAPDRYEQHSLLRDHAAAVHAAEDEPTDPRPAIRRVLLHYLEFAATRARSMDKRYRLGDYFDGRTSPAYTGPDAWRAAVADLELEQANLSRAVRLAGEEHFPELCWQLCEALSAYLFQLDLFELGVRMCTAGLAAAEQIRQQTGLATPLATMHLQLGTACFTKEDNQRAAEQFDQAEALADSLPEDGAGLFIRAKIHQWQSFVHQRLGRHEQAVQRIRRSRDLVQDPRFPAEHHPRELALVHLNGVTMFARAGQAAEAIEAGRAAMAHFTGHREVHNTAKAAANFGEALAILGGEHTEEAQSLLRSAFRQLADLPLTSWERHTAEVLADLLERTGGGAEVAALRARAAAIKAEQAKQRRRAD
ncbi:NB-ARC domain-containing protein [Crossiella sp. CA198]|uniref:NB-ARC domain-containing protein n=1 Tax=Crossiella sp. CA198 TaxID=3455607 RepID=UPI003F8D4A74